MAVDGGSINSAFSGWSDVRGDDFPSMCTSTPQIPAVFQVPPKTSFLELWGPSGLEFRSYDVAVSPSDGHPSYRGIAFNPWETAPNVMYATDLDPNVQYTVNIVNYSRNLTCIHKAVVYSSEG